MIRESRGHGKPVNMRCLLNSLARVPAPYINSKICRGLERNRFFRQGKKWKRVCDFGKPTLLSLCQNRHKQHQPPVPFPKSPYFYSAYSHFDSLLATALPQHLFRTTPPITPTNSRLPWASDGFGTKRHCLGTKDSNNSALSSLVAMRTGLWCDLSTQQ